MKNKLYNGVLIIFILIFALRVITIFIADRCYSMSMSAEKGKITPDQAITLLNIATKLDSTNANLYYQKYELLNLRTTDDQRPTTDETLRQQLHLLRTCINLCPSWPAYHLFYALTLNKFSSNPNVVTRKQILSELQKASELKPYSELYSKIYKRYLEKYSTI